jgi:hypothetical protein
MLRTSILAVVFTTLTVASPFCSQPPYVSSRTTPAHQKPAPKKQTLAPTLTPLNPQNRQSGWPFCDATVGLDDRAADIVSRLSLADKITATVSASAYLPSVGLPPYQWWSEATHGISGPGVHHNGSLPGATNTALPILTSCSFNRTLWHATGNAIAREGVRLQRPQPPAQTNTPPRLKTVHS